MPKATFPTLLVSVLGYRAFDKAGPSTLPSVGHPLLKAFMQVGRSALPLITQQLGIQRSSWAVVLGNPHRPFSWWSLGAKKGNQDLEAEILQAQTAVRWYQECCGVTIIAPVLTAIWSAPCYAPKGVVATLLVSTSWASMAAVPNSVPTSMTLSPVVPEKALLVFSLPSRSQVQRSEESEVNVAVFWASVRYLTFRSLVFSLRSFLLLIAWRNFWNILLIS